nr:hypothetical protein [Tanacetum cinerariifolium]
MNYQPVTSENQSNPSAGFQENFNAGKIEEEADQQYMLFLVWSTGSTNPQNKEGDATFDAEKHESTINLSPSSSALSGEHDDITKKKDKGKSPIDYFTRNKDFNEDFEDYSEDSSNDVSVDGPIVHAAGQNCSNNTNPISVAGPSNSNTSPLHGNSSFQDASQSPNIVYSDHENVGAEADFNNLETSITEELLQFKMQKVWILVDLPHGKKAIGQKKEDRIVINQDKYVTEILKKFGLTEGKSASTPIDKEKPLLKDPDGEDVDVHIYRSMIGSLMYLTSSRPDIMFVVCACACF